MLTRSNKCLNTLIKKTKKDINKEGMVTIDKINLINK